MNKKYGAYFLQLEIMRQLFKFIEGVLYKQQNALFSRKMLARSISMSIYIYI